MRQASLVNSVVKEVLARIGTGLYPPGQRLPAERKLAQELQVSRITLRHALTKLQSFGVISARHGSGNYVRQLKRIAIPKELESDILGFDSGTLRQTIVARKAIERTTAALAARHRSSRQLRALGSDLAEMRANLDSLPRFLRADMHFHRVVAEASGNRVMVRVMDAITEQQKFSQLFTSYGENDQQRAVRFHERILKAVEERSESRSARAMLAHLSDMEKYVESRSHPRG